MAALRRWWRGGPAPSGDDPRTEDLPQLRQRVETVVREADLSTAETFKLICGAGGRRAIESGLASLARGDRDGGRP